MGEWETEVGCEEEVEADRVSSVTSEGTEEEALRDMATKAAERWRWR